MTLRFSAHLDTLYASVPPPLRYAAAARDGFECVEFWSPPPGDPRTVARELARLGLAVASVNTHQGPDPDDFGQLGNPAAAAWWREDFERTLDFARQTGSRNVNVLVGGRRKDSSRSSQLQVVLGNLGWALGLLADDDPVLLLEPLNSADRRSPLLRGLDDALSVLAALGRPERLRLLFDVYHLFQEENDLIRAWRSATGSIGHIQVADYPGRGAPGSGEIHFPELMAEIDRAGYSGWIGLEYFPAGGGDVFGWLNAARHEARPATATGTQP
jgi:hydroxypyruvate isomerase